MAVLRQFLRKIHAKVELGASFFLENQNFKSHREGEVRASVTKWHMGEGAGSKIGQKSVSYYLNGPYGPLPFTFSL